MGTFKRSLTYPPKGLYRFDGSPVVVYSANGIRWILPTESAKLPGVNLTYKQLAKRNARRNKRR